jgi:Fic family protein
MLEEGAEGFEGGMNARKYGSITQVSKATATRDLQELLVIGVLKSHDGAGGRSTSYKINL